MFRLFHLPLLALRDVVTMMSLRMIFLLSLTSKETVKRLRPIFPKHHIHLSVALWPSGDFRLESKHDQFKFEGIDHLEYASEYRSNRKRSGAMYDIGGEVMQVNYLPHEKQIELVWTATDPALQSVITYIAELFQEPVISFELGYSIKQNHAMKVFRLIQELKLPIKQALIVDSEPNTNSSQWINLDDFLDCEDTTIGNIFNNPIYQNEQTWNSFFKKWMGSEYRLNHLRVNIIEDSLNFEKIVRGLTENRIKIDGLGYLLRVQRSVDGRKSKIRLTHEYVLLEPDFDVERE